MSDKPPPPDWLSPNMGNPDLICNPERYITTGGLGAGLVGIFTGWFDLNRIPSPTSPLPPSASPKAHQYTKIFIHAGALWWRVFKRVFIGSILYPVVICQFQGSRKSTSIVEAGIAGGICGAIFGLRGGPPGAVRGAIIFMTFTTLVEGFRAARGV